ncbi:MAG: ribonuclease E/G [Clostridia bacterium]|nr:ribonuclease E/G [Clostridia bacterium]NCC43125.1 ribonuclease E/G [Clostridia bacterium]
MKQLVITHMDFNGCPCLVTAQTENGRVINIHVEKPDKQRLLGSIHVGKVQKVLPNINGAFVEIENHLPCYYPYTKNTNPIFTNRDSFRELKAGDELLVQVTQEALKTKAPCVSSNLSFTGNYLVLTTENTKLGVSPKIPKPAREGLKSYIEQLLPANEARSYGVIIRTNAAKASMSDLSFELQQLQTEMDSVIHKGKFSPCFTRIKDGVSAMQQLLKNIYWSEIEKVVTDDRDIFQLVDTYIRKLSLACPCHVNYYQDDLLPLHKLYRLEHSLIQAVNKKVWLKSGGFLVIEQTEAFVSIDVNSGKSVSKKQAEEMYRKMNLEAAKEIALQLRLRNLYGMILIDFINMKDTGDQSELINAMRTFVKDDRIKTVIVDVTALGIMEVTRKKEEKSLAEQLLELNE